MAVNTITFKKDGDYYAVSLQLEEPCAFHIERSRAGIFNAKIASVPTNFAPIYADLDGLTGCCHMAATLDFETAFAVYPKQIILKSETPVNRAYMITS